MNDTTTEVWKEVPGTNGMYEASSTGRVRSYYNRRGNRMEIPRIAKQHHRSNLKHRTYLCIQQKWIGRVPVHRLVASAFYGAIPDGYEVDHINGMKHDNRVENLRIVTRRQNHLNRIARANSGFKNVHRRKDSGLYQVYVDGKYIGTYQTVEEALDAATVARSMVGYPDGIGNTPNEAA